MKRDPNLIPTKMTKTNTLRDNDLDSDIDIALLDNDFESFIKNVSAVPILIPTESEKHQHKNMNKNKPPILSCTALS